MPPNENLKANGNQKPSGNGSATQTNARPGEKAGEKKANNGMQAVSCLAVTPNEMEVPRTMEAYLAPAADGGRLVEVGRKGDERKKAYAFMAAPAPMLFIGEEEGDEPGETYNGKVNIADFWTCFNNACLSELGYWKCFHNFKVVPADWESYVKGLEREVGLDAPEAILKRAPRECEFCAITATKKCGHCKLVYYCGRWCQAQDWKTHKVFCKLTQTDGFKSTWKAVLDNEASAPGRGYGENASLLSRITGTGEDGTDAEVQSGSENEANGGSG
eukprot:g13030.t1